LTLDTTFGLTRFCGRDFAGHWKGCNHTAQAILKAKWFEVIALQFIFKCKISFGITTTDKPIMEAPVES
jgi:hypothetical protein